MRNLTLTAFLWICLSSVYCQIDSYMFSVRNKQNVSSNLENNILKSSTIDDLIDSIHPYLTDSLSGVRLSAYNLIYKAAVIKSQSHKERAVITLLRGYNDGDKSISGSCISHLKYLPVKSFNSSAIQTLDSILHLSRISHFRDVYMLAGYVGAG